MEGNILNGNLSYEIGVNKTADACKITILAFSKSPMSFDMEVLYRRERGGEWLSDINVQSATANFVKDSVFFEMQSDSFGYENVILWNYNANGLTLGSFLQLKFNVVSSVTTFNFYGQYTFEEKNYQGLYHEIKSIISEKVIGVDNYNNYMCSIDEKFVVINRESQTLFTVDDIYEPVCAQQMNNNNYLILDESTGKITEVSDEGIVLFEFNNPSLLERPKSFVYDELTNNLLVSGGEKHIVAELSWNEEDKGVLVWHHGTFTSGSTDNELSFPTGVAYDTDVQTVYIADAGNKRVKKITRLPSEDIIEIINGVTKDGVTISFNDIIGVRVNNNKLIVTEQREVENYSDDIYQHPSLSRALKYNHDHVVSKNKLEEYENLLFAPL
jgi:hypothetical protein